MTDIVHGEVITHRQLTRDVWGFELYLDRAVPYVAGQWVNLYLDDLHRSYSIATAPRASDPRHMGFAVTRVAGGPMSNRLCDMAVGRRVRVEGPYGFFTRERAPDSASLFFVGTGTGLTPLRAMIHHELTHGTHPKVPVTLLFGCRTRADILFGEELRALSETHDHFRYEVTLSQADPSWDGRRGYVQVHIRELLASAASPHVFICGLSNMVRDMRHTLKTQCGLDRKQIHTERYD